MRGRNLELMTLAFEAGAEREGDEQERGMLDKQWRENSLRSDHV